MKKLILLTTFALLGGAIWAASPSNTPVNPFQDNLICFDNEFAGMTELEQLVEERNATYTQLATENSQLLANISSDHQDISDSLLGAGGQMDQTLKVVLIVLGVLAVLALGCCVSIVIWGNSWYYY